MVKYDADQEITNIYENLQIIGSQFFTDMLLFVYIWSTSNIYWFICIRIRCQRIPMNSYSVTFDYSVGYLMSNNEGNFKLFVPTYSVAQNTHEWKNTFIEFSFIKEGATEKAFKFLTPTS